MSRDSIIVYRNPIERDIYESGIIFPLMCSVAAFFVAFTIGLMIMRQTRWQYTKAGGNIPLIMGAIAAILTFHYM